ncbi:MAG TPA: sigma-70 family RNA polymerase sigma factor [Steroidobacteraceae bacterium]|nr:sigma-70 family RNA polymerase sigma factor [Steroidobacteraceae bacterium]
MAIDCPGPRRLTCVEMEDDRLLVQRLLAGDQVALRQFFDEYFDRLYRFAYARLRGDATLAEDAAQNALVRALRGLSTWRGEASLFSWLAQICRNEIADLVEKSARIAAHTVSLDAEGQARDAARAVAAPEGAADKALAGAERLKLIRQVLDELPGRYGEILELKYIEEWDVERIAQRVGLSFEAAQSQLQRARAAFRSALAVRGFAAGDLLP